MPLRRTRDASGGITLQSSAHLFLPVAGVPSALADVRQAVLDARAEAGDAVADGSRGTAGHAVEGLA